MGIEPRYSAIPCRDLRVSGISNDRLSDPIANYGLGRFHPLIGASGPGPQLDSYDHRWQLISSIWNVLSDGTLRATLPGELSATGGRINKDPLIFADLSKPLLLLRLGQKSL